MGKQTVLILGGGIGGLVSSNMLKDKLKGQTDIKIVDQNRNFQFPPSYPWLMLGNRTAEQVQRNLGILKKKEIEVIQGVVSDINLKKSLVKIDESSISYDYLVIALGASYAPEKIPGLLENSYHIYDLESALKFQDVIKNFKGGTIAVGISSLPFKCPAAPYEVAFLLDHYFEKKKMKKDVKIRFFTPEGLPLAAAGQENGEKAVSFLTSRGIETDFKVKLKEVKSNEAIFEDGKRIKFDLLFAVPPHKCPVSVEKAGLIDQTGWVPVDPNTLATKYDNVYAVGDINSIATPSGFTPYLPKAGVFAHGQAEVVANNIAAKISGKGKMKSWDGNGSCFLLVGHGKSAFVKGNWFTKPKPTVKFYPPSRIWYMQKFLFEKYWMHHYF